MKSISSVQSQTCCYPFTDIVGYTALRQQAEETSVPSHN